MLGVSIIYNITLLKKRGSHHYIEIKRYFNIGMFYA
ncbi:hypothetical protein CPS_0358 [Colwellia psychrerythraea 34H]|uniref:Uncharacterized protein n=1 Tax=Colwellia psychrerythraea (strain 34H / ATCC BAA-681) TaxID=167879 RepID=Q489Z8_COLP3|nr:hypothetical protein CPS_0358 [Colwellia psychrerythraea 34H]